MTFDFESDNRDVLLFSAPKDLIDKVQGTWTTSPPLVCSSWVNQPDF